MYPATLNTLATEIVGSPIGPKYPTTINTGTYKPASLLGQSCTACTSPVIAQYPPLAFQVSLPQWRQQYNVNNQALGLPFVTSLGSVQTLAFGTFAIVAGIAVGLAYTKFKKRRR